jgi:2-dehydropantoate 2-reductase
MTSVSHSVGRVFALENNVTHIAVIGPGAIGSTLAAWLAKDVTHRLTICARSSLDRLRIIAPDETIEVSPAVLTHHTDAMPVDWVIAATKTYDAPGCMPWIERLTGSTTRLAVVQNGVEHRDRFAALVPPERTVPVIAYLPAERLSPGVVLQRDNGRLVVPDDPAALAFSRLFASTPIRVENTPDWLSVAWQKLALNAAGAVDALTLQPARIAQSEEMGAAIRALVAEVRAVGRAEGANLPDNLPDIILAHMRHEAPDGINSIHADRRASRAMEIDARNGVIVRAAERHGIEAPVSRMLTALLRAVETSGNDRL